MRIGLYSDLHVEFDPRRKLVVPNRLDVDVIVLAGDIETSLSKLYAFAAAVEARQRSKTQMIYVAGNHEFYDSRPGFGESGYAQFREAFESLKRSHFLERDPVDIGGVRFVGATLWAEPPASEASVSNDFVRIVDNDRRLRRITPADIAAYHRRTVEYLETAIDATRTTVVVTHHPPTPTGISDSVLASMAVADLTPIIERQRPLLWLHGHLHESLDYRVGSTRVVCNPRGYYPDALNADFSTRFVIDVGA